MITTSPNSGRPLYSPAGGGATKLSILESRCESQGRCASWSRDVLDGRVGVDEVQLELYEGFEVGRFDAPVFAHLEADELAAPQLVEDGLLGALQFYRYLLRCKICENATLNRAQGRRPTWRRALPLWKISLTGCACRDTRWPARLSALSHRDIIKRRSMNVYSFHHRFLERPQLLTR